MINAFGIFLVAGWIEFVLTVGLGGPRATTMGITPALAVLIVLAWTLTRYRELLSAARVWVRELSGGPAPFWVLLGAQVAMLAVGAWQSTLPPHHPQEYDALNYHMALARQHLLLGDLGRIPWSVADLFSNFVQWAMAPAWFALPGFHKIPQYLGTVAAFCALVSLGRESLPAGSPRWLGWVPALAVFTTHGVAIQFGMAMLDITNVYFILAAVLAWHRGQTAWAGLHAGMYAAAKSFHPLQLGALAFLGWIVRRGWHPRFARAAGVALVAALVFSARPAWVSLQRAGTPVFPIGVCALPTPDCSGSRGEAIRLAATQAIVGGTVQYGNGREPVAWLTHLWRISVPTRGVNNEFDYPLGLSWLIWVVALGGAFLMRKSLDSRSRGLLWGAVGFWLLWWFGGQQSRWLYSVLALGWVGALPVLRRVHPWVLVGSLAVAALFSLLSLSRAYKSDFGVARSELERVERARIEVDPLTGLVKTQAVLYWDQPLSSHASGDPGWILTD